MDIVLTAATVALIYTVVNVARYLRIGDSVAVLTQLVAWLIGWAAVSIAARTDFGAQLGAAGLGSQLFYGAALASLASVVHDFYLALDNNSTLIPPRRRRRHPGDADLV